MPYTLLCRNRVVDFTSWKTVFDSHADAHREAGLELSGLWTSVDDPSDVHVSFQVSNLEKARAFLEDPACESASRLAGVVEGEYRFLAPLPGPPRKPVVLRPGEGRDYPMGRLRALFLADGEETGRGYSISEWWLEAHTKGPGAHSHDEDDVFYVLEGTMSVLVNHEWIDATPGTFVLVPGGVTHDFENRGNVRAGVLNLSFPGGFEVNMPAIAEWFRANPPENA